MRVQTDHRHDDQKRQRADTRDRPDARPPCGKTETQRPARLRALVVLLGVLALHGAAAVLLLSVEGMPSGTGSATGEATAVAVLWGMAGLAYLAGIKHSYDWDHLAAIDNSTRHLVARGNTPVSTGFAFSLGHSTVVFAACLLVAAGAEGMRTWLQDDTAAHHVLGLIGTFVSGAFLLIMGLLNGSACWRIAQALRQRRRGEATDQQLNAPSGVMARLMRRPLARVQGPGGIYLIGLLFGLGFDTATTIGLLVLAAGAALAGAPPLALLALPLAFAAAMTLCDTVNGIAMLALYRQALRDPVRRAGFNATATGLSACSALVIAVLALGTFAHEAWQLQNPVTRTLTSIDLGHAGLALVGGFVALWISAALIHRRNTTGMEA